MQGVEHGRQGRVFVDRAREHFGPAHEARAVEHQPQGEQRAIAALLLGVAAFGLGLGRRLTLEEGVGQVVQRDRLGQGEQVRHLPEQVGLDRRAPRQQGIGGPVEAHHAHPLEVHAQQLAEGRTLAQPAPAGALRARCCHARDDGGHGQRALRAVEAEPLQQSLQAELLHGPQPDIFDADRARADQLQGTHIHRLQVGALDCGGRCAIEELRGDALGIPLHLLRTGQRHQFALALEQLLDPGAQHGPVPSLEREVAAEVEQGVLADPVSAALVAHEAVRVIDVAAFGCAYLCVPDEHGRRITAGPAFDNLLTQILCHYIAPVKHENKQNQRVDGYPAPKYVNFWLPNVKLGLTECGAFCPLERRTK